MTQRIASLANNALARPDPPFPSQAVRAQAPQSSLSISSKSVVYCVSYSTEIVLY